MRVTGLLPSFVLALAIVFTPRAGSQPVGTFSAMSPGGAFADGWQVVTLPDVAPTRYELVGDDGVTVVRATAIQQHPPWPTGPRNCRRWRSSTT